MNETEDRHDDATWACWLRARITATAYPSLSELARVSGINVSVISRWLTQGSTPTVAHLRQLSGPLDTPLLELLVAAGHLSAAEAGLERERPSIESGEHRVADHGPPPWATSGNRPAGEATGVREPGRSGSWAGSLR